MDPKLKAILQKAKQVDQAAKKYDTVDRGSSQTKKTIKNNTTMGLYEQMSVGSDDGEYNQVDVYSEAYKERVSNSKLPPEIQKAMKENPIPQVNPFMGDVTNEDIMDLNPINEYDMGDEREIDLSSRKTIKRKNENIEMVKGPTQQGFDAHLIKKMIAEELAKVLPSVVESYFDKKIIKENTRLMKVLLKSTQNKSVY
jgi:hypothetical protein